MPPIGCGAGARNPASWRKAFRRTPAPRLRRFPPPLIPSFWGQGCGQDCGYCVLSLACTGASCLLPAPRAWRAPPPPSPNARERSRPDLLRKQGNGGHPNKEPGQQARNTRLPTAEPGQEGSAPEGAHTTRLGGNQRAARPPAKDAARNPGTGPLPARSGPPLAAARIMPPRRGQRRPRRKIFSGGALCARRNGRPEAPSAPRPAPGPGPSSRHSA